MISTVRVETTQGESADTLYPHKHVHFEAPMTSTCLISKANLERFQNMLNHHP